MKIKRVLLAACSCALLAAPRSEAALWINGEDPSTLQSQLAGTPLYAGYASSSLNFSYTISSTTGSGSSEVWNGVLKVQDQGTPNTEAQNYSGGSSRGTGASAPANSGYFNLTADISGSPTAGWSVTGGTVNVENGPNYLLQGNLATGVAGSAFGFQNALGQAYSSYNEFEFGFYVTGGSQASIFGGNAAGGLVYLNANFASTHGGYSEFTGDWSTGFANSLVNTGTGYADTFVPEPSAFPVMVSVLALVCVALAPRKSLSAVSS